MKKILILFLVLISSKSFAVETASQKIKTFEKDLKAGQIELALKNLYADNVWISTDSESMKNLRTKMIKLGGEIGKLKEIVTTKRTLYGESFLTVITIGKYERQPIEYYFQFYKADQDWKLFNFGYSTDIEERMLKKTREMIKLEQVSSKPGNVSN